MAAYAQFILLIVPTSLTYHVHMSNPFIDKSRDPNQSKSLLARAMALPTPNFIPQPSQSQSHNSNPNNQTVIQQSTWRNQAPALAPTVNLQNNAPQFPSYSYLTQKKQTQNLIKNKQAVPSPLTTNESALGPHSNSKLSNQVVAPQVIANVNEGVPNRISVREPLKAKIQQRNGHIVGQFEISQQMLFNSSSNSKPSQIKIYESYKPAASQMWKNTIRCNSYLRLSLNQNWHKIIVTCQSKGLKALKSKSGIIHRLREGLAFYDTKPDRSACIDKVIQQIKETSPNNHMPVQVQSLNKSSQIDICLCFYFVNSSPNLDKQNLSQFINDDRLNLIKVYSLLQKHRQQQFYKDVFENNPQIYLANIIDYFLANYRNQSKTESTRLGTQIINLLRQIIKVKSYEYSQVLQLVARLTKKIGLGINEDEVLIQKVNLLMIELYSQSNGTITNGLSEEAQTFVEYYINNALHLSNDRQILYSNMKKLNTFNQYEGTIARKVMAKISYFIQVNQQQQENIEPGQMLIAMEAVLLLKQLKKCGGDRQKYQDGLVGVLYQHSPLYILNYITDRNPLNQLVLPLVCRYIGLRRQGNPNKQISINDLNGHLPPAYQFEAESPNFLLAQYLLKLLDVHASQSDPPSKIEELEQNLTHFDAKNSRRTTNRYGMDEGEFIITRYIVNYVQAYAKQVQYFTPSSHAVLPGDSKLKQQINSLLKLLLSAIHNFIKLYYKFNQTSSSQFYSMFKMLANIQAISSCLVKSGLISVNSAHRAIRYRNNESNGYAMQINGQAIFKQIVSAIVGLSTKFIKQHKYLLQALMRVYEVWQSSTKDRPELQNYIIYLYTVDAIVKFKLDDVENRIHFKNLDRQVKGVNIENIVTHIIGYSRNKRSNQSRANLIQQGLFALTQYLMADTSTEEGTRSAGLLHRNVYGMLLNNCSSIINLCVSLVAEFPSPQANQQGTLNYCRLIRLMVQLSYHNATHQFSQLLKKVVKIYKQQGPLRLFVYCVDPRLGQVQLKLQQNMNKMIDVVFGNVNQLSAQMQLEIAHIAAQHDQFLLTRIVQKQYLPKLCISLLSLMDALTQNNHQSFSRFRLANRAITIFTKLFLKNIGVTVDEGTVSRVLKCIGIMMDHRKQQIKASQLVRWTHMMVTSLNKQLSSVKQTQIIAHGLEGLRQQREKSAMCIKVTQIMMIYPKHHQSIFKVVTQKKTHILYLIKIVQYMLSILAHPASGESSLFSHDIEKWFKCAVIVALKISQFVNAKATIGRCYSFQIKNQSNQTNFLIRQLIQSSQILDLLPVAERKQFRNFLISTSQFFALDQAITNQEIYYNFNEGLIDVAILKKQSFQHCFIGLANQIIKSKNKTAYIEQNKYRSYYLFHYFLKKSIDNQHGKYVRYIFDIQDNNLKESQINQKLQNMLNELVYFLTEISGNQSKLNIVWKTIILRKILKFRVQMFRINKFTLKIIQFCLQNLLYRRNMEARSQNLIQWLIYNQTVGILSLLFKTHSHCDRLTSNDIFNIDSIRAKIYKQIQQYIINWKRMGEDQTQKIKRIQVEPINIIETGNKNYKEMNFSKKNLKWSLKNYKFIPVAQKLQNKKNVIENLQNKLKYETITLWDYLKISMVLHSVSSFLNYYRLDVRMIAAIDNVFWSKLIEFCQQILKQYEKIHDMCFDSRNVKSQILVDKIEQNKRTLREGLNFYFKDLIVSNSQNYLNKVMNQYSYFVSTVNQMMKKTVKSNQSVNLNIESAYKCCYDIQQALIVFGVRREKKFYLNNNTKSISLRLSVKSRKF